MKPPLSSIAQSPRNSIVGWFFGPEEIESAITSSQMLNPSLDLSNVCNLNCAYCYIEEKNSARKTRKPSELSHDEIISVLDDFRSVGAKTVNLVGAGEPTIDPHFKETISYIARSDMKTVLFTNGIRLSNDPNLISFLYDNEVSVVLKYNSLSSDIQDLIAGHCGYARLRDTALDLLLRQGFAMNEPTRLGIDIIVFRGNATELASIHRWARESNIFPIAGDYIPTGRTEGGTFHGFDALQQYSREERNVAVQLLQPITYEQRRNLIDELRDIDGSIGIERTQSSFAYYGGGACTQILGLYVDITGNIWPCVARKQKVGGRFLELPLGNIRKGHLPSDLWRKHSYPAFLRAGFSGACPYKPHLASTTELHRVDMLLEALQPQ
jgi:MoaA/NifB/PqqE/SkfB family radical SAM enzyme